MPTVLITGVSRHVGGRLAAALSADPSIDRIIGLDTIAPRPDDQARLGRTEFVRADIRNPLVAKVLAQAQVDIVVHASVLAAPRVFARTSMKETNVIGTMQLLSACQRSETVRPAGGEVDDGNLRLRSARPGRLHRDHDGQAGQRSRVRAGRGRDGELRARVPRRRPDIEVSVLRLAPVVGPELDSPFTRYLSVPIVPTALGFDPRLQLLHEVDAVEVLRRATVESHPGTFNVAADGVVTLTQALRLARRLRLPVPGPALGVVSTLVGNSGLPQVSAEQRGYLNFGRVVDTTRLRTEFGYHPRFTTREALESYFAARPPLAVSGLMRELLGRAEDAVTGAARTALRCAECCRE